MEVVDTVSEEQNSPEAGVSRREVALWCGAAAVAAGVLIPYAVVTWQHQAHDLCVSDQSVGEYSNAVVHLPNDRSTFIHVWEDKGKVAVSKYDAVVGARPDYEITKTDMHAGPEIIYKIDPHTNLLVNVTPTEVTTACQTVKIASPQKAKL